MFELRPRQNSAYRSVRYSTVRKQTLTADSPRPTFSQPKPRGAMASTFYQTRTIDIQPEKRSIRLEQFKRAPYFDTYQSMFNSEKIAKEEDPETFKTCELKIRFANFDEEFVKPEGTEFTLLDPFHRPYAYLTVLDA